MESALASVTALVMGQVKAAAELGSAKAAAPNTKPARMAWMIGRGAVGRLAECRVCRAGAE